ncbi:MAG: M20/M25/M40 family metallo-hydrolase [Candidatus Marinimicrobia bacterium]|nr:M20/M25/M40 family metallo-hydrolase [Candidatus Neomarinimicrobiota bacterium]
MKKIFIILFTTLLVAQEKYPVDHEMVAKIREEGFERSEIENTLSYMTDVLGARLTNSKDMRRAQKWVTGEMKRIGLTHIEIEPFMDYGVSWDNEFFSIHMLEPDYQVMVGYPISHTPGIRGRKKMNVAIADIKTKSDLEKYKGKLRGKAVLSVPMPVIDLDRIRNGTPRFTDEELAVLANDPPQRKRRKRPPPNPERVTTVERNAFYKKEGVSVILETRGKRVAMVPGFARPGAKKDKWDRQGTLNHLPIVTVTPEHYNRMYRILERNIPVRIAVEIKTKIGRERQWARNVIGEIPGTDLKDEVVMLGAHFDTWHASPNASDNTSGVAVMLEAMRILKAIGVQPRRTIRIALWSGEEQGIHGSREYVHKHFGNPNDPEIGLKPDYEKFSAYYNQDYGPGQFRGMNLQGNENVREAFTSWTKPFHDLGMTIISPQSLGSTDHVAFDRVGLPAFQFLQDKIGGTGGHTNLDYYDTIPIEDIQKNAVIVASFVYHTAMLDERLPRKEE